MKEINEKIEYLSTVLIDSIIYRYMYNTNNNSSIKELYEEINKEDLIKVNDKYKNAFLRIESVIGRLYGENNSLDSFVLDKTINDENVEKVFTVQKLIVVSSNMYLSQILKSHNIDNIEDEDVYEIENIIEELDYLIMLCINYLIKYIVTGERKVI